MDQLTCDAAQQTECGRVAAVLVDHAAGGRLRHRYRQRDGLVELAPARLDRDDRRHGHPVAQKLDHQFRLNRLSLMGWERNDHMSNDPVSFFFAFIYDLFCSFSNQQILFIFIFENIFRHFSCFVFLFLKIIPLPLNKLNLI